jgi:hypothetical protein
MAIAFDGGHSHSPYRYLEITRCERLLQAPAHRHFRCFKIKKWPFLKPDKCDRAVTERRNIPETDPVLCDGSLPPAASQRTAREKGSLAGCAIRDLWVPHSLRTNRDLAGPARWPSY